MKRKVVRNSLILLLAAVVTAAAFSACSGRQEKGGTVLQNSAQNDQQKSGPNVGEVKKYDPVILKYFLWEHPNWPLSNDTPVLKKIAEKTGVTIEYIPIPAASYNEKLNITMTSGDLPDLMGMNITLLNEYGQRGAFLALDQMIPAKAPNLVKALTTEVKMNIFSDERKIYGIPRIGQTKPYNVWMIRKDWLDRLKLKEPETLEDWDAVLRAFRDKDPDGNGVNDTVPMCVRKPDLLTNVVAPAFGLDPDIWSIINGKIIYTYAADNFKKEIEWLNRIYKEKLLDKEYIAMSLDQWKQRMSTGKAGAALDHINEMSSINTSVQTNNPAFNLMITLPPKGPDGKRGLPRYNTIAAEYSVGISKNCKNPDAAIRFLDYLFSEEGSILTTWGIEGLTFNIANGKKAWSNELLNATAKNANPLYPKYGIMQFQSPRLIDPGEYELRQGKDVREAAAKIDNYYIDPLPKLSYTKSEQDKARSYDSAIKPVANEYVNKFITGELPLSDWDKYIERLKKLGLEEYEKIQNDSYKRFLEMRNSLKK